MNLLTKNNLIKTKKTYKNIGFTSNESFFILLMANEMYNFSLTFLKTLTFYSFPF